MPTKPESEAQRRAMHAAASGKSTLGIPQKVGKEMVKEWGEAHDVNKPDQPIPDTYEPDPGGPAANRHADDVTGPQKGAKIAQAEFKPIGKHSANVYARAAKFEEQRRLRPPQSNLMNRYEEEFGKSRTSNDVTKPNLPVHPTHTIPPRAKPIQPPTPVSGFTGARSAPNNPAKGDSGGFSLPERVTHSEMVKNSRKYGGW